MFVLSCPVVPSMVSHTNSLTTSLAIFVAWQMDRTAVSCNLDLSKLICNCVSSRISCNVFLTGGLSSNKLLWCEYVVLHSVAHTIMMYSLKYCHRPEIHIYHFLYSKAIASDIQNRPINLRHPTHCMLNGWLSANRSIAWPRDTSVGWVGVCCPSLHRQFHTSTPK